MNMDSLPPAPRKPISLARLATIFAVVFLIAFGLCTRSFFYSGGLGTQKMLPLVTVSVTVEVICLAGLLVIAVLAIVRMFRK